MRPSSRIRRPNRGHSVIGWANDLVDQVVKRLTIVGDKKTIMVRKICRGYQITALAQSPVAPWRVDTVAGAVMTISGAYIIDGNNPPVAISGEDVTVLSGTEEFPNHIVLEYDYSSKSGLIYPTSWADLPQSEPPDKFRCSLHHVALLNNQAVHLSHRQQSDIIVP